MSECSHGNHMAVLRSYLAAQGDLAQLREALKQIDAESECHAEVLTAAHARSVLERFLAEELTASEVELWADGLEIRADIEPESRFAEELTQLLFELSTPELFPPLSRSRVMEWLALLSEDRSR